MRLNLEDISYKNTSLYAQDLCDFIYAEDLNSFIYYLVFISVLLGMVVLLSVRSSAFHKKLLSIYGPSEKKNNCNHPFTSRRHLFGDNYFQNYKYARCTGNKRVITGVRDNSGSTCTELHCNGKVFCGDNSCICRHSN
jgi:hypothetical protein